MKNLLLLLGITAAALTAQAQNHYLITFKDKGPEAIYLSQHPSEVLSEKALARRAKNQVKFSAQDLPISRKYLTELQQNGIQIRQKSKWLNTAQVETNLSEITLKQKFPAIRSVKKLATSATRSAQKFPETNQHNHQNSRLSYGASADQLEQLNLDCLHDKGYQGKGILIAVFDTGFPGVNTRAAYDSLNQQNRVVATRNFVNRNNSVYGTHDHGATVFSTMAANLPGVYVGGAARASFALAITENLASETHQEELNWTAAAEWADSLGADIIHTSLGYKNFDPGQGDYTNALIDGDTPIITRAADLAAQKGILVVSSAGNDGNLPATGNLTSRVNPPCDGDSVLCVGSVTFRNQYSSFSSVGPTAKNRIKPDVVAWGSGTAFITSGGGVGYSSGTSLAAPLISALAACLMEANPQAGNMQVYQAIIQSADKFSNPDNFYGHGLPDACKADSLLRVIAGKPKALETALFRVYPTIFQNQFTVEIPEGDFISEMQLYTITGQQIAFSQEAYGEKFLLKPTENLPAGLYILQFRNKNGAFHRYKVLRN